MLFPSVQQGIVKYVQDIKNRWKTGNVHHRN